MELDKELYYQAYQLHQQWYEAELEEQVRTAGHASRQQAWQQFLDLWSFGRQIQPEPTPWQQEEKNDGSSPVLQPRTRNGSLEK